ncbi:MAG: ABC transporter ATP-binding protein/permease [Phenylobacterium sp.]|uniref:ABCB family ABC transporter ATP-binding protein/permease n=1 Tax=Phenylobacterium sp. TaxID=1871053 RepID=UPI002737056D|nr:ABC transporter ATP-binding protein/permease [Phenylobacterium sp.]MDP3748519.1 ABC transporter ATP-binding protein/permease [Phenylobacterium sp.]
MSHPMVRRLLSLLWPRGEPWLKARVLAAVALVAAAKLIAIGAPLIYKQAIDALSSPALAVVPLALILAYGVAQVGAQVAGALRQLVFARVAQRAIRLTALEVFKHLHALSLRFHLDRQTGGLSRVIERGVIGVEYLLELALFNVLPTLLELTLVSAILWRFYSAGFALAALVTILCYLAFTFGVTQWQVTFRREMNARDVAASVKATDSLLNYETVKYFGAEAHETARYDEAKRTYEKAAIRSMSMQAALSIGQVAIIAGGSITVMIMAGRGVAAGTMTLGDFILVNAYLLQLYVPLGMLGTVYGSVKQALTDVEAMTRLLAEPAEVADRPGAPALAAPRGRIVFDRVSFAYDPRRPILTDLSFEAPAGKTVAVVGPSGGGKSTLARLLFRFYDVDAGAITIDGQDLRDVTQHSLRQAIGVVPQDTVLFNDTIGYNIAYGRAGASREEIEQAARLARIHDFILRLPDGYQTLVGERGLKLSGGEKQRVAIARVILKQPSVLIFDEATSALDSHTEQEIQASLREVSARRSTLVIAHRLSTIVEADEILVLDEGRIVEHGRHAELLAKDGLYASMWLRQRRAAERDAALAVGGG